MGRLEDMKAAAAKSKRTKPVTEQPKPVVTPQVAEAPLLVVEQPVAESAPPTKKHKKAEKPPAPEGSVVVFRCGCRVATKNVQDWKCPGCTRWQYKKTLEYYARKKEPDDKRLPPGSVKHLEWDGTVWRGTLTIPGVPEPFKYEASNEKATYLGLHDEWVKWQLTQPEETKQGTS